MKKTEETKRIEDFLKKYKIPLSVKTMKRIIKSIDNENPNADDEFNNKIQQALKNKAKRAMKDIAKVPLQIPNSYPVIQCLNYNLYKYKIPEFALFDCEYDYKITNKVESLLLESESREKFLGYSFPEYMILSALYSYAVYENKAGHAINNEIRIVDISIEQIFAILYPRKRFDKASKNLKKVIEKTLINLALKIGKASGKYERLGKTIIEDYDGFLFCKIGQKKDKNNKIIEGQYRIYFKEKNLLFEAKRQTRIIQINPVFLHYGYCEGNNHAVIMYLAYRITLAMNTKNKMVNAIKLETLDRICGKAKRPLIKRYMEYLVTMQILTDYEVARKHIIFNFKQESEQEQQEKEQEK